MRDCPWKAITRKAFAPLIEKSWPMKPDTWSFFRLPKGKLRERARESRQSKGSRQAAGGKSRIGGWGSDSALAAEPARDSQDALLPVDRQGQPEECCLIQRHVMFTRGPTPFDSDSGGTLCRKCV